MPERANIRGLIMDFDLKDYLKYSAALCEEHKAFKHKIEVLERRLQRRVDSYTRASAGRYQWRKRAERAREECEVLTAEKATLEGELAAMRVDLTGYIEKCKKYKDELAEAQKNIGPGMSIRQVAKLKRELKEVHQASLRQAKEDAAQWRRRYDEQLRNNRQLENELGYYKLQEAIA